MAYYIQSYFNNINIDNIITNLSNEKISKINYGYIQKLKY